MRDLGHDEADKEIKRVERQLRRIYSQATKDIEAKMEDFNKKYDAKYQIHLQEYKDGKITKADFDAWVRGQVFQREQWQAKRDQIVDVIYNSNKAATNIVNNSMYGTFAFNSNYQAYQIEKGFGTNFGFGLYDAKTVSNLVQNDPQILPKWKINKKKDYKWNYRKVNDAVTQGIIQGESLDKITKRLSEGLCAQNENTMKTFARTGMTQAQNAGRYQRQLDAKKMGINMKKEWMATLDNRTRHSHARLDGEKVSIDGDTKFSNGCRYPGDPEGPPHEIYNCRCTLVVDLVDFPSHFERYDNINGKPIAGMTYQQWEQAKKGQGINKNGIVYGSTFKVTGNHWATLNKDDNYHFSDGAGDFTSTRSADVYTMDDGTVIAYPSDIDTSKQDLKLETLMKKYYEIPRDFRGVMQRHIEVVDYKNPQDSYWAKEYNDPDFKSYMIGGEKITIFKHTNHDTKYLRDALCHEGGHYLDRYLAGTVYSPYSHSTKWTDAIGDDLVIVGWGSVTSYGSNALIEDFAESCMMLYSRDPNMMKKQFPNRTKILLELVKKYGRDV